VNSVAGTRAVDGDERGLRDRVEEGATLVRLGRVLFGDDDRLIPQAPGRATLESPGGCADGPPDAARNPAGDLPRRFRGSTRTPCTSSSPRSPSRRRRTTGSAPSSSAVIRLTREVEEHRGRGTAMNEALLTAQRTRGDDHQRPARGAADRRRGTGARRARDRGGDRAGAERRAGDFPVAHRRRAIRTDVKRLVELLIGVLRDDEADESRDGQVSTIALLRRRSREAGNEP